MVKYVQIHEAECEYKDKDRMFSGCSLNSFILFVLSFRTLFFYHVRLRLLQDLAAKKELN